MKIIENFLANFGYVKKPKKTYTKLTDVIYNRNGVWYGVYDDISEQSLTDTEKNDLSADWEIKSRLSPVEIARYKEFMKHHKHEDNTTYFEGPKHWIGFGSGGGIGKCVYVKCNHCGEIFDLTDNTTW